VTRVELSGHDIVGIRADNPGPFTLTGTNSWIVYRDPAWLVDPGPHLPAHVHELEDEVKRRGGLGGIALTHDHADHNQAIGVLRGRFSMVPVAGGRGDVDVILHEGSRFGPLEAVARSRSCVPGMVRW
jgi:glyoxylase-like metal-dependent hydrolase (beta-lactamase superfamily II)